MDLEQKAIERLQAASEMSLAHYGLPLVVTTSGGKDSSVCVELARRAGIPFEVQHNHTSVDAPETVRFVRSEFKRLEDMGIKCTINYPTYKGERVTMWSLIPQKSMPPTRIARYCCSVLKEGGGAGRFITTGVRWAESTRRKNNRGIYENFTDTRSEKKVILNNDNDDKRLLFENCKLKAKRIVNPIIDWEDNDVWDFLQDSQIPLNPLYKEGYCRIGCIGCPMAGRKGREIEFKRWPKYKDMYLRAFDKMLKVRESRGKIDNNWRQGTRAIDVFNWWMEYDIAPGQIYLDELEEEENE